MSIQKAIITPAEADVILALEADWLALTEPVKVDHIAKASTYIQLNWNCEAQEIDWDDLTTVPDDVKEACAYYALADSRGNLYPETSDAGDVLGAITESTKKLGSLQTTTKYDSGKSTDEPSPLQYPNALMSYYCINTGGSGSKKAVRT